MAEVFVCRHRKVEIDQIELVSVFEIARVTTIEDGVCVSGISRLRRESHAAKLRDLIANNMEQDPGFQVDSKLTGSKPARAAP
jgi:hypothetical protein